SSKLRFGEVLLERPAYSVSRAVQEHPLVPLGEVELAADVLARKAGDVAQRDHRPLHLGELGDRRLSDRDRLGRKQLLLRQRLKTLRRRRPVMRPPVALGQETVWIDDGLVIGQVGRDEGREGQAPTLTSCSALGGVGEDAEEPGLEGRTAL